MKKIEKLKRFNQVSYETIAKSFDVTRQKPWHKLGVIASTVKDGFRILDCGCGNGRLLKALPKVNFEYLGVDSNRYLLEQARQAYPNRQFQEAQLEEVSLDAESFDIIFCIAAFHHLVGRDSRLIFLKKCNRALKPGGQLIMTVWNLWQRKYVPHIFSHFGLKVNWNDFFIPWRAGSETVWRYYHGFTKRELHALLGKAGFRDSTVSANAPESGLLHNYVIKARR